MRERGFSTLLLLKALAVLAIAAAVVGLYRAHAEGLREEGRKEVRADWAAEREVQKDAALGQAEANAKETRRRLEAQRRNQEIQDAELARARDDARRNAAAADQLRDQNASAARQWRDALGDSATERERAAAADAIGVLADVLGRADRRAGVLATYADAARTAGLKCERDYDSLTPYLTPER